MECIKGGNGIRAIYSEDVICENVIKHENASIVYQRTEEEGEGGKAYISVNDYNIFLEYYEFSDHEIETYLKSLDLTEFM